MVNYLIIGGFFLVLFGIVFKNARKAIKSSTKKFPVYSMIGLLYPITAGIYVFSNGARIDLAFYYGIGNLGYLLLFFWLFKGTFLILGLKKRSEVFIIAVIALASSIVFTNLTL